MLLMGARTTGVDGSIEPEGNLRISRWNERIEGIGWKSVREALKGTGRQVFRPEGLHGG
jgi:hypothetical protein